MFAKPRLRTILILVNLAILILPLSGFGVLRIYESALVRQTESELIAQSAFIAAVYQASFERLWPQRENKRLRLADYGRELANDPIVDEFARWQPRPAVLDLATDTVLPPAPAGLPAAHSDPIAKAAGREITDLIKKAQITTLASIRILDYNGVVVASTGSELGERLTNREEIQHALQGKPESLMRQHVATHPIPTLSRISRNTCIRVFVTTPIILHHRLAAIISLSRTPKNFWQAMYEKRYILLYTSVVLFAIVIGVSLITSFRIGRPIHALIRQAELAARGEKGAVSVLAKPGSWELGRLSEAVSIMAKNLEHRADYIRDFAAHVSHEFKTPLTSIQGALELLSEHAATMSEEQRKRFILNAAEDTRRLERLVAALLELARADTIRPSGEVTDLKKSLVGVLERYRENGTDVTLTDRITGPCPVTMERDSLTTVLTNLFDNAIQHGGEAVRIRLLLEADIPHAVITLEIHDSGPGISAANVKKIFDPFFTSTRNRGGTGLGLSITRALLNSQGGGIEYIPSESSCKFRLLFRAAGHKTTTSLH